MARRKLSGLKEAYQEYKKGVRIYDDLVENYVHNFKNLEEHLAYDYSYWIEEEVSLKDQIEQCIEYKGKTILLVPTIEKLVTDLLDKRYQLKG